MEKILKYLLILPVLALAQADSIAPGFHKHDGFFLSMSVGGAGGPIIWDITSGSSSGKVSYSGPGPIIDLKIGGAINESFILSFDVIARSINGPEVKLNDVSYGSASSDISVGDALYGIGGTYYFNPYNVFVSATLGTGVFTVRDDANKTDSKSEFGPGVQIKVGKEWWVGKNWGLGMSGGAAFISADDQDNPSDPDYKGKLSTTRFFVMFNTTFN